MATAARTMRPQLVIPMTGVSSRFTAAGYDRPKHLLEVDGQTVIEHVLDMYPGWDDVVAICRADHLANSEWNLRAILERKRPDITIVSMDKNDQGPGLAVLAAERHIDRTRPVVVNYCDFTMYWDSASYADELSSGELDGSIVVYRGFHPHMAHSTSYAYVRMDGERVVDIQEKQPWTDDPTSEFASSGTYGFASGAILLDSLRDQIDQDHVLNGEFYLSLTYKPMLSRGLRVGIHEVQHFMQWGTPQDWEEYKDFSASIAGWTSRPGQGAESRIAASRVMLASGAGNRFRQAGYLTPKPALDLGGISLLEQSLAGIPGSTTVLVTREDLPDDGLIKALALRLPATVVSLPGLTRGQAESALFGLESLSESGAVTVAACDAIGVVDEDALAAALAEVGDDGLICWLADPYSAASRHPEKYGWVASDAHGMVQQSWLKMAPGNDDARALAGTFTFGSTGAAIRHITSLIADDERVNGEFYLDSLVQRLVDAGIPVRALKMKSFVSVGTPEEYETVKYWQSCFHKWSLHPYKVSSDALVPAHKRMDLDSDFRSFERHR